MNCFLKMFLMAVAVSGDAQMQELKRQYVGYLQIFNKVERPNSFNIFLENLSRIAQRKCDYYVDKTSDEELTYIDCWNKISM